MTSVGSGIVVSQGASSASSGGSVADRQGSVVTPPFVSLHNYAGAGSVSGQLGTGSRMWMVRMIMPKAGTLHDISVYVTAAGTPSHFIAGVYDTGDALAGSRTRLFSGSSTTASGSVGWQVIGDPALTVTAGQHLEIGFITDDGVMNIGLLGATPNVALLTLPTNFLVAAGGASPKLHWTNAPGSFALPATVTEANCTVANAAIPAIIARVS